MQYNNQAYTHLKLNSNFAKQIQDKQKKQEKIRQRSSSTGSMEHSPPSWHKTVKTVGYSLGALVGFASIIVGISLVETNPLAAMVIIGIGYFVMRSSMFKLLNNNVTEKSAKNKSLLPSM